MSAVALQPPNDAMRPRPPDGLGVGAALAVLVHLALVAALAFGVNWRTHEPDGVVAELWSAVPQVAAPRAVALPPSPPTPAPVPAPVRRAPAPPVAAAEAPPRTPDAQISIERARREEARRQVEEREAQRQAAQRLKAQQDKAAAEQAQRDKAHHQEQQSRETEARQKRDLADKERRDEATLQTQRDANLRRIQGQAEATREEGTGTAARTSGVSAGYAGRIKARIKPNIVFADSASAAPDLVATAEVRCAPDGSIVSRKLLKSSGSPAWDDAVLRAIDKTDGLPRDTDGRVPAVLHIEFRPRE